MLMFITRNKESYINLSVSIISKDATLLNSVLLDMMRLVAEFRENKIYARVR